MHAEKTRLAAIADAVANPGDSYDTIAARHGIGDTTMKTWLKAAGHRRQRGHANPNHPAIARARQREKDIPAFSRDNPDWTEKRIARKFGLTQGTVSEILRRMGEGRKPGFGSPAHPRNKKGKRHGNKK